MGLHLNKTCLCLIILYGLSFASGKRSRELMYEPITGASCFRRLNGTHQTGCSSDQFGSVGALHLINVEEDFEFLLNNPPAPPYAPLIPPHLFTRKHMLRLKNEAGNKVAAVLLINRTNYTVQFSQELTCPNQYSGIKLGNSSETATCNASGQPSEMWNPWGTGLMHEDFPFPIYYIADPQEIEKLEKCFEDFNNFNYAEHALRSLCSVEINTFMSAAVSTEVCMRRSEFLNNLGHVKYCDPLEGRNIYATLFPRNITADTGGDSDDDDFPDNNIKKDKSAVQSNERFILVSCRLDTTSMFDGVGLGMLDSLLGYSALASAAHMLAQLLPEQRGNQPNVLFVIFNGESYDYIGSQRLVFDLERLAFPTRSTRTAPLGLENIELMLDIGVLDNVKQLRLHSLKEFPAAQKLLEKLQHYAASYNFKIDIEKRVGLHLPPTSAQSFLRRNETFPAVVLNSAPDNRYYHSIYDDAHNANFNYANKSLNFTGLMEAAEAFKLFAPDSVQMRIRNVSTIIALALYETLSGLSYTDTKIANPLLADEFLYCFLMSADCPLFRAASPPSSLSGLPIPPNRYISVMGGPQEAAGWTYRLLGFLLGHQVYNINKDECKPLPMKWFAGFNGTGECRRTTQNYSHALSPAFLMDNYDWKSGEYSTWTESTWSLFSARIFLRPSRTHEIMTFSIGLLVFCISICLLYIISRRADILFEDAPSSTVA